MSGIAVALAFGNSHDVVARCDRMMAAMAYRGPDGCHTLHDGPIAMGHCLLRTTVQPEASPQPLMALESGVTVALDGYIANVDALRDELISMGRLLRDRSDAELLLRAYEIWGEAFLPRIEGEFSLVVWDRRSRRLIAAKDHQGLRSLFYHFDGEMLLIASDMKAILAATDQDARLNTGYLAQVMTDEWYTWDETPWIGINRVKPAHFLRVQEGSLREERYWSLPTDQPIRYRSDGEYIEHYREVFTRCVRESARSTSPIACEVSGGLDSSAVYAVAQDSKNRGLLPADGLRAFTLAAPPGSDADEIDYARAVTDHFGQPLDETPFDFQDLEWYIDRAVADRDLPFYANGGIAVTMHERMRASGCRAVLGGGGGDQWLDGSFRYYSQAMQDREWNELANCLQRDVRALGPRRTARLFLHYAIRQNLPDAIRSGYRRLRGKAGDTVRDPYWLSSELRQQLRERREAYDAERRMAKADHLQEKLEYPYYATMFDLQSRFMAGMELESRNPMFARSFIEFSARTPDHIRQRGGERKFVHRKAMSGLLPEKVIERQSKALFNLSFESHNAGVRRFCLDALDGPFAKLVDDDGLTSFLDKHCVAEAEQANDAVALWEVWGVFGTALLAHGIPIGQRTRF